MIRELDRVLLRKDSFQPGWFSFGYVLFPFVKSDSYKLRAAVAGEMHEFAFQLRSY